MNQGFWGGKFSIIVEEIVVWGEFFSPKKGGFSIFVPKIVYYGYYGFIFVLLTLLIC